ncbi:DUF6036 family nucleotidyltransferase [Rugamonas sp. A1-17]|nr:DUF6036 family nucleotidyltransferase [Rugamonas sp. A1-17]
MKQTPLGSAILRLFGDLGERLSERYVPADAVRAYLFGGCAVHQYASARVTSDVDVEFDYRLLHRGDLDLALRELPFLEYDDPEHGSSQLVYDRRFNTTLCPLHEDYRERARRLDDGFALDSPLSVWIPCPEDLAITKLGRLAPLDIDDILLLLEQPGASVERFEQLAREAIRYYVGPDLSSHIDYIKKKWSTR